MSLNAQAPVRLMVPHLLLLRTRYCCAGSLPANAMNLALLLPVPLLLLPTAAQVPHAHRGRLPEQPVPLPYPCRRRAENDALAAWPWGRDAGGWGRTGGNVSGRKQASDLIQFSRLQVDSHSWWYGVGMCLSQNAPSCKTPLCCRKVRKTLFSASTAACQFPAPYAVFLSAPQAVVDSALPPAAATTMVHPHCDVETFEERLSQPPHNEPQVQYGKLRVGCVLLL